MGRSLSGLSGPLPPLDDDEGLAIAGDRAVGLTTVPSGRPALVAASEQSVVISFTVRRSFRAGFPARPDRAAAVRRMLAARLAAWCLDDLVDSVILAADELFANAVEHGSAGPDERITVAAVCAAGELRVEVSDPSPVVPVPRSAGVVEESGRGLAIVDALAADWGTEPPQSGVRGKTVWFTMPLGGEA